MVEKFPEKFPDIPELFNLRNANHSIEDSRNSGSTVEWQENFRENVFKNLGIPREVVLFFENFGKCCFFRHWKLLKIQTGRFGWMESAQNLYFFTMRFLLQFRVMRAISLDQRGK